jgi:signal peptidase I
MNKNRKLLQYWKEWRWFLCCILVVSCLRSSLADWNFVPSGSMKPTILEGDEVWVDKLAYDLKVPFTTLRLSEWKDPSRGDIIVFFKPGDGMRLVKRVIGLPGDTISMEQNRLLVNGQPLSYKELEKEGVQGVSSENAFLNENLIAKNHPILLTPSRPSLDSFLEVRVPDGEYFVMGDNRDNSADSRFFGFVPRNRIIGKATNVVLSVDKNHHWTPRWNRFLTELN